MSADLLVMFAKAPVPGRVKTRLAAELGEEEAAALQAAFIRDLGRRFADFEGERLLAAAPNPQHPVFRELIELGWRAVSQGPGGLGERIHRVVVDALASGPRRIVIIGSDSPTLPKALVSAALEALDEVDVTIGPVFDGGYYLLGTRRDSDVPFVDIPWGTSKVFSTTLAQLETARISYRVLPFWYDVDVRLSLDRLADHLGLEGPYGVIEAPSTEHCLRQLDARRG